MSTQVNQFEEVSSPEPIENARYTVVNYTVNSVNMNLPPLLTVKQAARIANTSERTVYRMCEKGKVKACRLAGGAWRINSALYLEFLGLS